MAHCKITQRSLADASGRLTGEPRLKGRSSFWWEVLHSHHVSARSFASTLTLDGRHVMPVISIPEYESSRRQS